ncbi:MAG: HAD-IA family hydrolase [Gammaproteobacteria bacterium]
MKFPLLVFDWDGTLMDSEARIVSCIKASSDDLGLPVLATVAIRDIIGLGLREAINRLYPGSDDNIHSQLAARYRHHFLGDNHASSSLFPGAKEMLEVLREQGYLLAVATGKGRHGLDHVLDETGCQALFHASRCADETCSKPHPQMLLEIMECLKMKPADTLMIGDTEYDMQMASNAGAAALAVSYGVHTRERLLQCSPLGCLDDIAELPVWLTAGYSKVIKQ